MREWGGPVEGSASRSERLEKTNGSIPLKHAHTSEQIFSKQRRLQGSRGLSRQGSVPPNQILTIVGEFTTPTTPSVIIDSRSGLSQGTS